MPTTDRPRLLLDGRSLAEPMTGIGRYVAATLEHLPGTWDAVCKPGTRLAPTAARTIVAGRPVKDVLWNELTLPRVCTDYDVLWAAFGLLPRRRVRHTRTVATVFDTLEREGVGMARGLALTRRAGHAAVARNADVLVAISDYTAERFEHWYGRRPELVAEPGPSLPEPSPAALESVGGWLSERGWPRVPVALSVGAPVARKNVVRSLEAAASLPSLTVVLVGGAGDEHQEAALAAGTGSGRLARFGFATQDELAALYRLADVLLYTPLAEGYGIPLLDARRSGLRIVTSSDEPMRSAAGAAAEHCDPRDTSSIAAALRRSLESDSPEPEQLPGWEESAATMWKVLVP